MDSSIILDTSDLYLNEKGQFFSVILKTQNGTPISNQTIDFTLNSVVYNNITNNEGIAKLQINLNPGTYTISTRYGNFVNSNTIHVRDSNTIFITENATNAEIQDCINSAKNGFTLEFIGEQYDNISLIINDKTISLVSYSGTKLYGVKNNPIISISGIYADGVQVSGLNLIGGLIGIEVKNAAMSVKISNNSIVDCQKGIDLNGAFYCNIVDNKISNIKFNAINLKDSNNIVITNNTIYKNQIGIYYDSGCNKVNIINNTLSGSSDWAINFDKSGEYSNVYGNTIMSNTNGIFVNCKADALNIEYNKISENKNNGINFGEDYRKGSQNQDLVINNNVIADNGNLNILAKYSIYNSINIGSNWLGSDDKAFASICPKIKTNLYSLKATQIAPGSFEITIGTNGMVNSLLPSYTTSVSFDGGKTWKAITVSNGKAIVHVSEGDGNVIVRDSGPEVSFTLQDYVPYVPPVEPTIPAEPSKPVEPTTNGTQDSNKDYGGSSATNNGPSVDGGNTNVELAEAAATVMEEIVQQTQPETPTDSQASETSTSSESQSVSKSITIDEENIKILGIGAIILLFVLVILSYYFRDINTMINNKKGH